MPRRVVAAAIAAASLLALAGCAADPSSAGDGRISVVASTDVYGQIAEEVGGDAVQVTSLITSGSQDPHAFEASARDQLAVSRAGLIIRNGAGYDPFIDALIQASATTAPVITAVEDEPTWNGDPDGFNEHVWYDPPTMAAVADAIAERLATLDPAGAATFRSNAARFGTQIDGLTAALGALATAHAGARVFVTEPVPLYLTDAAHLVNVTPTAFSEAVEEGQDVPPATLLASLDLLGSDDVRVVIVNAQTGGAETTQVVDAARSRGIPVLEFAETLPDGDTYVQWMQRNIDQLAEALAS